MRARIVAALVLFACLGAQSTLAHAHVDAVSGEAASLAARTAGAQPGAAISEADCSWCGARHLREIATLSAPPAWSAPPPLVATRSQSGAPLAAQDPHAHPGAPRAPPSARR